MVLPDGKMSTILWSLVLTQYQRVTDGQNCRLCLCHAL